MKSYFFAETAFHHQGEFDYIMSLIDCVAKTQSDGIKFQILTKISDFVSTNHSAYSDLSKYCFSSKQWEEILDRTKSLGLDIIGMPLNCEAIDLMSGYDPKYMEIHSVSFNDQELFKKIKGIDTKVILGVGGRTLDEVSSTIDFFEGQVEALMVGYQSFPSLIEKLNLGKIKLLKDKI